MSEEGFGGGAAAGGALEGLAEASKKRRVDDEAALIGAHGAEYVKQRLARDGPHAIRDIQQHHALNPKYDKHVCLFVFVFFFFFFFFFLSCSFSSLPADVIPVLELLDMHGVKRSSVYVELAEKLRETLLPRLASLSQPALESLLKKTFPYVSIEELSSVPMAIMMRLDSVDPVFLAELAKHSELYEKAPMKIKRQIWAVEYELFRAHVFPSLEPFLASNLIPDAPVNEIWNRALEEPRQRRRNCQAIGAMLTCLDKSRSLYKSLLDMCWRLFREIGNPLFCTLRADVLMALHDNSVTELYQHDPYHELCWILDAATRDRSMADALVRDLTASLAKLSVLRAKEKAEQAMLLCNPHVYHALLRTCCVSLMRAVQEKALPSDSKRCPTLKLLVKLLVLGKSARELVAKQTPTMTPKAARREILTLLCPWLASTVVAGMLEERGTPVPAPSAPSQAGIPSSVVTLLAAEGAARKLLHAFVTMRVDAGESRGLSTMLAAASPTLDGEQDLDFLQTLVTLTIAGMKSSNATTTKWLSVQQAVMQTVSSASRLGLRCHIQSLRLLEALVSRSSIPAVIGYLRTMVQNAAPADYTDKDVMLRYIGIVEQLVPEKVEDEEVQFVLDYLHLGGEE